MVLSFRIFQLAQLLILIDAGYVLPNACSPVEIQCVGEGATCKGDQKSLKTICNGNLFSICRICGKEDLTCHSGICLKNIGSKGDACRDPPTDHVKCAGDLECRGGRCQEPDEDEDEKLLGRGEKCDPYEDNCIKTLMCDINQKCSAPVCISGNERCQNAENGAEYKLLQESYCEDRPGCTWVGANSDFIMDDSTRVNRCVNSNDCHFGEYCNNNRCLEAIEVGKRLNAPCVADSVLGDDQCGYGMMCTEKNPFEVHSKYKTLVCKWGQERTLMGPFDKVEGERCRQHYECGRDLLCTANSCSKAYTMHAGEGCHSSTECGTGMVCSCPNNGDRNGGRERCIVNSAYQTHNKDIDDFNNIFKPLVNCINKNKCKLKRCIRQNCEDLYDKWDKRDEHNDGRGLCMAKKGDEAYIQQAGYEGVPTVSNSRLNNVVKKATDWEITGIFFIVVTLCCLIAFGYFFKTQRSSEGGTTQT